MTLSEGDTAPDVAAPNQYGETVEPDFAGTTVVYFYPEDDTPGCKVEADQFGEEADAYADAGVTVLGVSMDDVDSHRDFAEKQGIEFDLLADPEGEVVDAFDVETVGDRAKRSTVVLQDGEVVRVYENVNPDGHARDVLMDLLDDGLVEL